MKCEIVQPKPEKDFFGGLESLRGVAALWVALFHLTPATFKDPVTGSLWVENGYLMVDLFFVLSGFVIFHTYGAKLNGGRDLGRFMFLRFGRLYPLHLVTLVVFLGVECAKKYAEVKYGLVANQTKAFSFSNGTAFAANLILVQPFFPATNLTFNHPSWSIGTEFYTYLLFAVLMLAGAGRKRWLWLGPLVSAVAVAGILLGGYHYLMPVADYCYLRCVAGFFLGVWAYQIHRAGGVGGGGGGGGGGSRWLALLSAGLTVGLLIVKPTQSAWDFLVLPLFVALVVGVAGAKTGLMAWGLNLPVLRWLGRISYSVYMWHLFVEMITGRLYGPVDRWAQKVAGGMFSASVVDGATGVLFILFTLAVVLAVAHVSHRWIEVYFQDLFRGWARTVFPPARDEKMKDPTPPGLRKV